MKSRQIVGTDYVQAPTGRSRMEALLIQRKFMVDQVTRHYANLRKVNPSLPESPKIGMLKLIELKQLDSEIIIAHAKKVREDAEKSKDPLQKKKTWGYYEIIIQNSKMVWQCHEYTKVKSILSLLIAC